MYTEECTIRNCSKKVLVLSRGLCSTHYYRFLRHKNPLVEPKRVTPLRRLYNKSFIHGECVLWSGANNGRGYGVMTATGLEDYCSTKNIYVHRAAWIIENGKIPAGMVIDHICHRRSCINPHHLQAVSPKQNSENLSGQRSNNTSGYRGVTLRTSSNEFIVQVRHKGTNYRLYHYPTAESANDAAVALRNELFTNNIQDQTHSTQPKRKVNE